MPEHEANDTAHQWRYAWSEGKEAQLRALRNSARTSTDDLVKYLALRAERAGIEWYFLRAETAFLHKNSEAASEGLAGDDPEVLQEKRALGWTRFRSIDAEKAFHHHQSLLAVARRSTSAWNGLTSHLVVPLARQRDRLINYVLGPPTAETSNRVAMSGPARRTASNDCKNRALASQAGEAANKLSRWESTEFKVAV